MERCSVAGRTFHLNEAAVGAHDAVDDGEPKAAGFGAFVFGKKWLKHAGACMGVHAETVILNGDAEVGFILGGIAGCGVNALAAFGRADGECAAAGHGIAGVVEEALDGLDNLDGVNREQWILGGKLTYNRDVLWPRAQVALDEVVQERMDVA